MLWADQRRQEGRLPDAVYERLQTLVAAYHQGMNADTVARDATIAFATSLAGEPMAQVEDSARAALERFVRPVVFAFSRPLVQALEQAGFACWVVTGVLEPLASILAAEIGVGRVLGTSLTVRAGRVDGVRDASFRSGWKAERARCLLADPGVDLARSAAFGDSGADLSLMERVGHAVAVRPKPSLRAVAVERGYAILNASPDAPDIDGMAALLRGAGVLREATDEHDYG